MIQIGVVSLKNMQMWGGKIVITLFPYYNVQNHHYAYKARPALIMAGYPLSDEEFLVLQIATLKRREFYSTQFDYCLSLQLCHQLGLHEQCFIRCHKQTTINKAMIGQILGDLKQVDAHVYKEVVQLMREYDTIKLKL